MIAKQMRQAGICTGYCIISASGAIWHLFAEFAGFDGAKEALDLSGLPTGSVVIRICDGVELAHISANSMAWCKE